VLKLMAQSEYLAGAVAQVTGTGETSLHAFGCSPGPARWRKPGARAFWRLSGGLPERLLAGLPAAGMERTA
jgi:hypothetical protein